ncbi:hypothetical protein AAC03nite_24730 [Alicyclobacillus acidoterrestris]|nr:hypothetical protein AAC03nite_24730 [Alicyclobacillus acidoterrestris]
MRFDEDGGRYAVNGTSSTWDVQSDPKIFEANGIPYTQVAFLHTSFPTYGYIGTDGIVDAYKLNFGNGGFGSGYYELKTQKTLSCYIYEYGDSSPHYSVPSGALIIVKQGDIYGGNPAHMSFYAYKMPGDEYWYVQDSNDNGGVGYIDTGIEVGSAPSTWGIVLNR